jgi:hypothetical protein
MAEAPRPRPARQSSTLPVRAQGCNSPALLDVCHERKPEGFAELYGR